MRIAIISSEDNDPGTRRGLQLFADQKIEILEYPRDVRTSTERRLLELHTELSITMGRKAADYTRRNHRSEITARVALGLQTRGNLREAKGTKGILDLVSEPRVIKDPANRRGAI